MRLRTILNEIDNKEILPDDFKLSDENKKVLDLIEKKEPMIFITGRAGTGKTTFIFYLKNEYKGNMVVLAPTGMTAINIKGQTIHSFFRFPPRVFDDTEIKNSHNELIDTLDMIVIDEISMVQSDLIDHMDFALKKWRKSEKPFGGIQMIFVGDCFQLSPWIKFGTELKKYESRYRSQWFFDAHSLLDIDFEPVNFTKIYRQKDPEFIKVLNRLRINRFTEDDLNYINTRCVNENLRTDSIILTTTNEYADKLNNRELEKINGPIKVYTAYKKDKITSEITKIIPEKLQLKVGAKVVFTKNTKHIPNGTIASVKQLNQDSVVVYLYNSNQEIICEREKWEQFEYVWDDTSKKIKSQKIGEYNQIPLRLGWAITIHKSQGLTFDSISIDLTPGIFAPGQTYVALSRCKTVEGIHLARPIEKSDVKVDNRIIDFYTKLFCNKPIKEINDETN